MKNAERVIVVKRVRSWKERKKLEGPDLIPGEAFKDYPLIRFHAWYTQYTRVQEGYPTHAGWTCPLGFRVLWPWAHLHCTKSLLRWSDLIQCCLHERKEWNQTVQHNISGTNSHTFPETFIMSHVSKTQQDNQITPWCLCSLSWGNTQFNLCKPNKYNQNQPPETHVWMLLLILYPQATSLIVLVETNMPEYFWNRCQFTKTAFEWILMSWSLYLLKICIVNLFLFTDQLNHSMQMCLTSQSLNTHEPFPLALDYLCFSLCIHDLIIQLRIEMSGNWCEFLFCPSSGYRFYLEQGYLDLLIMIFWWR